MNPLLAMLMGFGGGGFGGFGGGGGNPLASLFGLGGFGGFGGGGGNPFAALFQQMQQRQQQPQAQQPPSQTGVFRDVIGQGMQRALPAFPTQPQNPYVKPQPTGALGAITAMPQQGGIGGQPPWTQRNMQQMLTGFRDQNY